MNTNLPTVISGIAGAAASAKETALPLLDRDHSILAFNWRVFDWACRADVPLLERLRYLCIVSSNLDEFFEVRSEPHLMAYQRKDAQGLYTVASFTRLSAAIHELVARQYALYNDELMPAFRKEGIETVSHGDRNAAQRRWVKQYFEQEVQPLLIPVGLDPSHPFPQVANKSLNFIVRLGGKDAFGRENDIAIVKVPRALPRLIPMPDKLCGQGSRKRRLFVSLSSVIRAHLEELFPGREMRHFSQFRVTRHSDLAVDEEDVRNLRTALRQGLEHRHYGQAVRLEVSAGCSQDLADFLLAQFDLPEGALYRVHGPVNLVRMGQLVDLVNDPRLEKRLRFPAYQASYPAQLAGTAQGAAAASGAAGAMSIFERLERGDVLIHQPYERFDGVLDFLREAVNDPQVLAIRQTVYRTGANSALMELLREAVRRGKEVTVVLELKARFDEEVNIDWAERLEFIGVQVLYGVVGLKTHAKAMLVTRRVPATGGEGKGGTSLRRYAHLSTGNYNPATARFYTDWSHLTADPQITADVEQMFIHLAGQNRLPRLHQLWMAPFHLHKKLLEKIETLQAAAAAGKPARLVAKMNALTDEPLIRALIAAGRQGVKIDLIVRGACMLPAGVPGQTTNIRVRSIIGRFLEHARVFYFRHGDGEEAEESLYLASADWMNRNMLRRVELAWPVLDPALRQRVIDETLTAALKDNDGAWELMPDGRYERLQPASGAPALSVQRALMGRYGA